MVASSTERHVVLGFDPGGRSGVAIIRSRGGQPSSCDWGTVGSVDAALDWYASRLAGAVPIGIGIDTPLCWETGNCGWRGPDLWLRAAYPEKEQSVISTNSAYGAMIVQGLALALRLRARFAPSRLHLNETHPKVLYYALRRQSYPRTGPMASDVVGWLCALVPIGCGGRSMTSDEWDAVLSAWATLQGLTGAWSRDLMALAECPCSRCPTVVPMALRKGSRTASLYRRLRRSSSRLPLRQSISAVPCRLGLSMRAFWGFTSLTSRVCSVTTFGF